MTIVYNFYGGPGAGKSTSATTMFSLLKQNNFEVEYVSEYVKQWVWEQRNSVDFDQIYFFAKQARKEYTLFDKVDYVVTDCSPAICTYYVKEFGDLAQLEAFRRLLEIYYDMCKSKGIEIKNVWVNRANTFSPNGRLHSLEQSLEIDKDMRKFLEIDLKLNLIDCYSTSESIEELLSNEGIL